MYLVYIRPIFEYTCEVWDNCDTYHSNKLEKLQLDTARIVTELPIFTKTDSLYFENVWEPLHSRRHRRKVQLFYKIHNGSVREWNKLENFVRNIDTPKFKRALSTIQCK